MTTFPDLLAARLARDPGQPFVTYYDEDSSERTELSVTTYANWVAKTANLLADELMLDPGATMRLRLPAHWLGAVFLGAARCTGLAIVEDGARPVDLLVTGPPVGGGDEAGAVLACSLDPFAGRFHDPLPDGVEDYGLLWPGQGDVFVPVDPAAVPDVAPDDHRILTDVDPASPQGERLLVGALRGTGSLVLLRNAPARQWPVRSESERATVTIRADQPIDR